MSGLSIFLVIFQLLMVAGIVWAILNESLFIQMENRLFDRIVAFFRSRRDPGPKLPDANKVKVVNLTDDDEFARFAPFVA